MLLVHATGHSHEKNNLDTDLKSFTNINSKHITDIHVKYKTLKLLEDNIVENLDALRYYNNF